MGGLSFYNPQPIMESEPRGLIDFLKEHITPERWMLMQERVMWRSRYVTVAIENIYQPHNASAVLRTCDCFGFQDVHIIENENSYQINPQVEMGSSNWLDLSRYNQESYNSSACLDHLESRGYRLVATSPHSQAYTPEDIPLDRPLAIILGNEKDGLTQQTLERCSDHLRIPMYGFSESFNISVSAAIILSRLRQRLQESDIDFLLNATERDEILLSWLRNQLKRSDLIEGRYQGLSR
jgi:tRNA (guanosine-2'-O-)-methyltransferase